MPSVSRAVSQLSHQPSCSSSRTNELPINQMCTHLPDQVIELDHELPLPHRSVYQGVLLFADISGFTALSEKYSMNAKNGSNQLTRTLNGYLGILVEEIIQGDGDVIKYAGDAILAAWKVNNFLQLQGAVIQAIRCGTGIQNKCGEWVTDVGVTLRVKIGIASGEINIAYMGNDDFRHYVTIGAAVEAVNMAEKFCTSGDVVLSPSTWSFCRGLDIVREICDDGRHVKIVSVPDDLKSDYNKITTVDPTSPEFHRMLESQATSLTPSGTSADDASSTRKTQRDSLSSEKSNRRDSLNAEQTSPESLRVRRTVVGTYSDSVLQKLRLYIAKPVLRKLDDQQPLEYLSEMRQVSIVFVNMSLVDCDKGEKLDLLQTAMVIVLDQCKQLSGCLNKIFMFDKGCTFLIIFGLPGFKQENDCSLALQCSYRLKMKLDEVKKIEQTSIGVTTGSAFCGVVGHQHRHEYTVIGRKVNMAARLMMHYPDRVTCDNETFHHSKLPKANFSIQETKEMKGLSKIGLIREYSEKNKGRRAGLALAVQEFQYPILGRDEEMEKLMVEVRRIKRNPELASERRVVIFEGDAGIGKTRMLDAVIVKAMEEKYRLISCGLSIHDSKTPYFVVKSLLLELLEINFEMTHQEREHILLNKFDDEFILANLVLLNDLLHLKLPQTPKHFHMEAKMRRKMLHEILFWIVHCMSEKFQFVIFAIDDAHFMDPESWELISDLGHDKRSLVLLTMRKSEHLNLCDTAQRVVTHKNTTRILLGGMDCKYMYELACQLLDVVRVPKQLVDLLKEKSHGVPSWCEQLLREMYYDGAILIVSEDKAAELQSEQESDEKTEAGSDLLSVQAPSATRSKSNLKPDDKVKTNMVCLIAPGRTLSSGIPDSIRGMIQARIDRMEEAEQMVMKCSSILGLSFSRTLLEAIIPQQHAEDRLHVSIKRLLESGVLECASNTGETTDHVAAKSLEGDHRNLRAQVRCYCPTVNNQSREMGLMNCQYLRFQSASMQETAYAMLVDTARRNLHRQAATYLESKAHKCRACGGGEFDPTLHPKPAPSPEPERAKSTASSGSVRKTTKKKLKSGSRKQSGFAVAHKTDKTFRKDRKPSSRPTSAADSGVDSQKGGLENRRRSSGFMNALKTVTQGWSRPRSSIDRGEEVKINGEMRMLLKDGDDEDDDMNDENLKEIDMRDCECMLILAGVYPQLVRHWRLAGNIERTVHFLTEAGAAAMGTCENMQALSYLNEVARIIKLVRQGKNPFEEVQRVVLDTFELNIENEARIERLTGQALYQMGQMDEAIPHFNCALGLLGNKQPGTMPGVISKLITEIFKQWLHLRSPEAHVGTKTSQEALRLTEQARCLAQLFHEYLDDHQDVRALLTAVQQLNRAEAADDDLHELIIAYTCMMECCQLFNWQDLVQMYEKKAQVKCIEAMEKGDPDDMITMAHLFCIMLNSRLASGRITDAIDSGYSADRITLKLHDNDMRIQMLPLLAQSLLLNNKVSQCVEVLGQLSYADDETDDVIGQAWYYGCCLDLMLEAGFQLECYKKCHEFAESALEDHGFQTDQLPLYYLSSSLALWYSRRGQWKKTSYWQEKAHEYAPPKITSYMTTHGFAKLLECELIRLSQQHSKQLHYREGDKENQHLRDKILQHFTQLKKACRRVSVYLPRYYHLKAYLYAIQGVQSKAQNMIDMCIRKSRDHENELEEMWVLHSRLVWFDPNHDTVQDTFWLDSTETGVMDWHAAGHVEGMVIKYSLPLPHWDQHS